MKSNRNQIEIKDKSTKSNKIKQKSIEIKLKSNRNVGNQI